MSAGAEMGRRDFLKVGVAAGGGLVLGFALPGAGLGKRAGAAPGPFAPNAFLRIAADESVTVTVGKAEMGQGVYTSLPMLVAEELECDWARVRVEAAPVDPAYNHTAWGSQMTGGSTSVWSSWEQLSRAGAAARVMLVTAAARTWGVDAAECRAEEGFVVHAATGRRLSYGTLVEAAAALPVPQEIRLKDPSEWKILGRPRRRLDTPEKTDGSARFGIDVGRPGLLTAVIARPPVFGAKRKGFDAAKAEAVPGVRAVVPVDAGVAVVADGFWAAQQGREALDVSWDEGALAALSTEGLREEFARLAATPGAVARKDGDAEAALAQAARHIEATYEVPYLAHAPMEPLNCVAEVGPERCEVWTGTQFQTVDRDAAARAAGLPPEKVRLHTTFLGGGFGRRGNPASDFVIEAVQVAKAVGRPVKVVWTREDDVRGGYYRPMWHDRIAAALDAEGRPVAWRHTIVGQSILAGTPFAQGEVDSTSVEGAKDLPYAVPNVLVDLHSPKLAVPVLWWRSVGTPTRPSSWRGSSTNWPTPRARIPTSTAGGCSGPTRACWESWTGPRRRPGGGRRRRRAGHGGSPSTPPSGASPRRWPRCPWSRGGSGSTASSARWTAAASSTPTPSRPRWSRGSPTGFPRSSTGRSPSGTGGCGRGTSTTTRWSACGRCRGWRSTW